jgi:hypothetical protein
MIDRADMPPDVLTAFELYLDGARRNVSETARLCGNPRPTVQRWSERYRWRERAADIDRDQTDAALADARARHARRLTEADAVIGLALRARIGPDGTPYSTDDAGKRVDAPAPMATRTALAVLANHGIKPPQHATLDVQHSVSASLGDIDLTALTLDQKIALAVGRPLPPRPTPALPPPPPDFMSGQAGGRGGPEPPFPVGEDAGIVSDVIEGVFHDQNGQGDGAVPPG